MLFFYLNHAENRWVDALKCMFADECHHRDVNHTLAMLKDDDPNPFVEAHKKDAALAWRLENEGKHAWESQKPWGQE